jgi:hypothetical protein
MSNNYLKYNIDCVFIITPHILMKHNNYLYQNIKYDNYFIELLIYDHTDPLNYEKNYFFTLQKILKISIIRKYKNIMVLQSDILFKNNWNTILNEILNCEFKNDEINFGLIWLQSEQTHFTDYQFSEIQNKQFYRFNLLNDENKTITRGNGCLIIFENIYIKLYKKIKNTFCKMNNSEIKSKITLNYDNVFSQIKEMSHNDFFDNILSETCLNTDSFIIYPNIVIKIKKIEQLYVEICKILINNEKKNVTFKNYDFLNTELKKLIDDNQKTSSLCELKISDKTSELIFLRDFVNLSILNQLEDDNLIKLYNDYVMPYKLLNSTYNPNHFNVYYNFNKKINDHFDWVFYKYYYDDLINNELISNYDDSMNHYLNFGYKEHRYICLDEYLYDKNDTELNDIISQVNLEKFYEENKIEIDKRSLTKQPIIYYIKYMVNSHITVI